MRCLLEGRQREGPPVPKLLVGQREDHVIALWLGPLPAGYGN